MKNLINKLICLITLIFISLPSHANWYQVEVIIFQYIRPALDQELWYENPGLPSREDSIELLPVFVDDSLSQVTDEILETKVVENEDVETEEEVGLIPYQALSKDTFRLKNDYRILKLSGEYRPLLHMAWQQPGYDRDNGRAVHLELLEQVEELDESLPAELAEIQVIEEKYVPPEPIFDGTIRVRSSRFLHVDMDFAYFPENFQQILKLQRHQTMDRNILHINPEADYVRLTESRRIKLNELNYFDHPLFGVLLQVSRIETEDDS